MTPLKIGAIAITLILIIPIILGYGLASSDSEVTTKTSDTGTTSLSNTILNAQSDYYMDYNGSNNNSGMLQRVTSQGNNYYLYTSPDYVQVGNTVSSIPAYTTISQSEILSGSSVLNTSTASMGAGDPNYMVGVAIGNYSELVSDWSRVGIIDISFTPYNYTETIEITSSYATWIYIDGVTNTSYQATQPSDANGISGNYIRCVRDFETNKFVFEVGSTQYTGDWAYIGCFNNGSYTWNQYDFEVISPTSGDDPVDNWTVALSNVGTAKLTYSNGTVRFATVRDTVSHGTSYTIIDDTEYGNPLGVAISYVGSGDLEYYTKSFTQYANPSYGWYNADSTYLTYYNAWYNGFENDRVMLYVHFEGNGYTELYEDFEKVSPILSLKRANGTVTVIDSDLGIQTLGDYEYVYLVFDTSESEVSVYGVSGFPPMGSMPSILDSVTVGYDFDGYIEFLKIVDGFSTIYPVTADDYTTNGNSVVFTRPVANPQYTFGVRDSDGNTVSYTRWSATMGGDLRTITFTPISLSDGLYTFFVSSPQVGSFSATVYVGALTPIATSPIAYRVDNAYIVAGQFSSTVDYTLNLWTLFPGDEVEKVYINSIAVYGDSISIAGHSYPVTDGGITITDIETNTTSTVKLLKSTIAMSLEGSTYTTTINGITITSNSVVPVIYFGGEWSLTATRSTVLEETVIDYRWTPGEFALDKEGFVLCMILVAGALFVVLGMTGARSGAKVGLLAVICGGACMVGLMII